MQLHVLRRTACLTAYYDLRNDWLYLDWEGDLSLPAVQEACLELTQCFLHRAYPRVLNSNAQVTNVSWSVAAWLATEFLPHMTLAGVEHVAWVYAPSLRGRNMLQTVLNWLPGPIITAFDDLIAALEWLKQHHPEQGQGYLLPKRHASTQAQLLQEEQSLRQRVAAQQHKLRVI